MKQFLLLIFVCLTSGLIGQSLTISPNEINQVAQPSDFDVQMDFDVHNTGDLSIDFLWRIANADDIPAPWVAYVCDSNLCYAPGLYECPGGNPNSFAPDQSSPFNFHVQPNMGEHNFTFVFELFDGDDPTVVFNTIEITLNTKKSTSTDDEELAAKLAVYPNPTSDVFKIKNDNSISSIAIYNIVGKQIEKFEHTLDRAYNISEFRKGVYLVRLFDEQGNAVKALRLSKK